jgi:hypothetical protein
MCVAALVVVGPPPASFPYFGGDIPPHRLNAPQPRPHGGKKIVPIAQATLAIHALVSETYRMQMQSGTVSVFNAS